MILWVHGSYSSPLCAFARDAFAGIGVLAWGIVGAFLGFFLASLGADFLYLLYDARLVIGGMVEALVGGCLGALFGNEFGAKVENTFGERAILLLFWLLFCLAMCCLFWVISEWA
ncbi:hypothetical protein OAS39_00015 [Pirellulales bacterium]|nr:hypothetical protein [Pirellulales bacterium]